MKFIIHAGLHKTGTTSIQNFCGGNKNRLAASGFYYPSFQVNSWFNHSIPLSLICMDNHGARSHSVTSFFKTDDDRALASNKFQNYLTNEIKKQGINNTILISGEDISIFKLNELKKFKELLFSCGATEIKFICFVRHPVDIALSGAQELVRAGLFQFGEALRIGNLQKARHKFENFQHVFGKENIEIHNYDLAIIKDIGIIEYFLNLLGTHPHQTNELKANSSMRFEKCLILSSLVKIKDRDFIRSLELVLYNVGSKIVSTPQVYDYLMPLNEDDIEFLNKNYQISWGILGDKAKAEIDLILFDVYLKKLCHLDGTIYPKSIIMSIVKDIGELYPEISNSISKKYQALINS